MGSAKIIVFAIAYARREDPGDTMRAPIRGFFMLISGIAMIPNPAEASELGQHEKPPATTPPGAHYHDYLKNPREVEASVRPARQSLSESTLPSRSAPSESSVILRIRARMSKHGSDLRSQRQIPAQRTASSSGKWSAPKCGTSGSHRLPAFPAQPA